MEDTWREYFRRGMHEEPAHPGARDFMRADLRTALSRLVPGDASVLEVGCGRGDLVAGLSNRHKAGLDVLPEAIAEAQRRHPDVEFSVSDVLDEPDGRRFDA